MKNLLGLLLALLISAPAFAGNNYVPSSATATVQTIPNLYGALNRGGRGLRIIGTTVAARGFTQQIGTEFRMTGRAKYATVGGVSEIQLCYSSPQSSGSTGEGVGISPYLVRETIETAVQTIRLYSTPAAPAQPDLMVPTTGVACTPPQGVFMPPATTFYVRSFKRYAKPPTSPAVSAVSGGNLTPSTTYYYKITNVDQTLESGAATEVSAATGAITTLAESLTWTPDAYTNGVNVYRSTTAGAETFYAFVPAGTNNLLDTGQYTASAVTPPTANFTYYADRIPYAGESGNPVYLGGAGTDQTAALGALTGVVGPSYGPMLTPTIMLGDDATSPAYLGLGDSIEAGYGLSAALTGPPSIYTGGWFGQGVSGLNSLNYSIPGTTVQQLAGGSTSITAGRLFAAHYADYIVNDDGTNDLAAGQTWQQVAANHIALGKVFTAGGARYVITTLVPRTTSTDGWRTANNQASISSGFETARENYNLWVRGGMLVSAGTPVLSGGVATPYIYSVLDLALPVEVNSSNVLTPNGGFWQAPAAADYTAQVLTGSPTTTSLPVSTASYPTATYGLSTRMVLMTSGAASGQRAYIFQNSATTLTTVANGSTMSGSGAPNITGLTIAPSAGDTFSIYSVATVDGIHPSATYHGIMAGVFTTWQAAYGGAFGTTN